MQSTLNGKILTDIDTLYLKRGILYDEMTSFIKLHKLLIVNKVKSYKIAVTEIDNEIKQIDNQRCKNGKSNR